MKRFGIFISCWLLIVMCSTPSIMVGDAINPEDALSLEHNEHNNVLNLQLKQPELVDFEYENEDISIILNDLAFRKGMSYALPLAPTKIDGKVNFKSPTPLTLDEAWNLLTVFLGKIGFSVVEKGPFYEVVELKNVLRETLPNYINTSIEELPEDEDPIRYVYSFQNINVSNQNSSTITNIQTILTDMLTQATGNSKPYIIDGTTNTLIVTDKASRVKSVMRLINVFDLTGFSESAIVFPLRHTKAAAIEKIIQQLLPTPGADAQNQQRFGAFPGLQQQQSFKNYFQEGTKIIAIPSSNSLAVLGKKNGIENVKKFIEKYLDKPIGNGKSIIHIKELKYLNAESLVEPLRSIVQAKQGQSDQSSKTGSEEFSNILIVAEKVNIPKGAKPTDGNVSQDTSRVPSGGNALIVAARERDWEDLEKIIDKLDQPQTQVIIEVLITDITTELTKDLGAQARNRYGIPPKSLKWQSAQLTDNASSPWLNYINVNNKEVINTVRGVASDLLERHQDGKTEGAKSFVTQFVSGTSVISFKDGASGISEILEILDQYSNATILSQPFLITSNNKPGVVSDTVARLLPSPVQDQGTGGPIQVPWNPVTAALSVNITPRASKSGVINLNVTVDSSSFRAGQSNIIDNRTVVTNANIRSGDVLVLGGLSKKIITDATTDVPFFSKIPIIGTFFKRRIKEAAQASLTIFISATKIEPRKDISKGPAGKYTKEKASEVIDQSIRFNDDYETPRDPVTRLFFNTGQKNGIEDELDYHMQGDVFKKNPCCNQQAKTR